MLTNCGTGLTVIVNGDFSRVSLSRLGGLWQKGMPLMSRGIFAGLEANWIISGLNGLKENLNVSEARPGVMGLVTAVTLGLV